MPWDDVVCQYAHATVDVCKIWPMRAGQGLCLPADAHTPRLMLHAVGRRPSLDAHMPHQMRSCLR